jgi:pimeloyl-ACP methyl ester carboxylesterase
MSAIIVENGLVHYEALGRGKPILFLHGWLGSWRYWMPTMEAVSDRFRTYAFDLWGFGDSDKSSERYDVESYVSLVNAFMDGLGVTRAPIVGHALGAVAALLFATRMPERVDKLITVSLPLNGLAISRKFVGSGDSVLDRTLGRRQAQQAYPDVALEADKADPNVVALSMRSLASFDLRLELEKVTCPLLMVHGEKDSLVTPPSPDAIPEDDNFRQIMLRDSTHFPMLDEAPRFQRLLRDFMEGDLTSLELKDEWKRRAR